jgi:glycine cleavage system H protein
MVKVRPRGGKSAKKNEKSGRFDETRLDNGEIYALFLYELSATLFPEGTKRMDKYYSRTHEWVKTDGDDEAIVGISACAAEELGDITFVELPREGTDLIGGDSAGTIESVKASSEVFSPVSGTVTAVNHALDDYPALISESAEEKGWLFKLDNIDLAEIEDLMTEEEYVEYLKTL